MISFSSITVESILKCKVSNYYAYNKEKEEKISSEEVGKWSSILNFLAYMCTLLHTCAHVRREILGTHLGAALAINTS